MKRKILSYLQYLFFLGVAFFLVWWTVRKISDKDWVDIKNAFTNANYWLIIPVIGSLLISHYSRAVRWKILMEPLGYKPRIGNTYMAVLIGYMANLAVPRLGEVLKCTILARYEKVPADKLVGTIVAERAFDVLCLGVVIAITIITQVDVVGGYISEKLNLIVESKKGLLTTTNLLILGALLLLGIAAAVFVFKRFGHIGFIKKVRTIMLGLWHGVTSVRYLKKRGAFLFHSVVIWTMYLLSVWIGFFALRETSGFGIKEAMSVLTTGSLAMIVPTPGGALGVYQLFVQQTLTLYGLKETLGYAFGWLMWSVQFFQMLLSGAIAMLLLPSFNKQPVKQPTHAQG
jgi:glycosyltransferase 2 family protein